MHPSLSFVERLQRQPHPEITAITLPDAERTNELFRCQLPLQFRRRPLALTLRA